MVSLPVDKKEQPLFRGLLENTTWLFLKHYSCLWSYGLTGNCLHKLKPIEKDVISFYGFEQERKSGEGF
ncbi:MAG: hypothetical protein RBR42_05930 [Desulfomicrobium sp.]|nr:hypothetical protein [Desulfomicrobium sp.]